MRRSSGRPTVRIARADELATAGEVCVDAYAAAGQLEPGSPYRAVLRDAAARVAGGAIVLVALQSDDIVGSATICVPGSPIHEIGRADEVEFRFFAVRPDSWGAGVGRALVEAIDQPPSEQPTYEAARDELASVVARLEAGGLTLEESLALWERGEQLAATCQTWLDAARVRLDAAAPAGGSADGA